MYAGISLLVIITAIPAYLGQQKKMFLLLLYHNSSNKADKSCDHLNGAWEVGCTDRLQASQINVWDSNPNTFCSELILRASEEHDCDPQHV